MYFKIVFLSILLVTVQVAQSQSFLKLNQSTGTISAQPALTFSPIVAFSQSGGTAVTLASLTDLSYSTGPLTNSTVDSWVRVDMGSVREIAFVNLSARSSANNLNGRSIQISEDDVNWTTVVSNITNASTSTTRSYSFSPINARYIRVINLTGSAGAVGVSEFYAHTSQALLQSSVNSSNYANNTAGVTNTNNLSYTTGGLTASEVNAWIMLDMGSVRNISYVDLAAHTSTANLNGCRIQVSSDAHTWTTVVSSISGASITQSVRYNFTPVNTRYIRVYNPSSSSGVVGVSSFVP
jgi:hypothetical protein